MLAATNHLVVFYVPSHTFQQYLLHDLAEHTGDTDRPQGPQNLPCYPFKHGHCASPFPAVGTSPGGHAFSN